MERISVVGVIFFPASGVARIAGKGLVQAFEKWVPKVIGCPLIGIDRVYYEQTGRELSDYILLQQADKTVRYNQLPPEAEIVRAAVQNPDAICGEPPSESKKMRQQNEELLVPKQLRLDKLDPSVLLSTVEVANLTGFRPKNNTSLGVSQILKLHSCRKPNSVPAICRGTLLGSARGTQIIMRGRVPGHQLVRMMSDKSYHQARSHRSCGHESIPRSFDVLRIAVRN